VFKEEKGLCGKYRRRKLVKIKIEEYEAVTIKKLI